MRNLKLKYNIKWGNKTQQKPFDFLLIIDYYKVFPIFNGKTF